MGIRSYRCSEIYNPVSIPRSSLRVTHTWVSKSTIIGSDNAGILLVGPIGANFSEILIAIYTFSNVCTITTMLSRPQCANPPEPHHISETCWLEEWCPHFKCLDIGLFNFPPTQLRGLLWITVDVKWVCRWMNKPLDTVIKRVVCQNTDHANYLCTEDVIDRSCWGRLCIKAETK